MEIKPTNSTTQETDEEYHKKRYLDLIQLSIYGFILSYEVLLKIEILKAWFYLDAYNMTG